MRIKLSSGPLRMKQRPVVIMIDEKTLNRPESLRIPPRCPKYRVLARLVNRGGSWISHIMLGAVIAGHPGQTAFWWSRQSRANPSLVPNSGIPCRAGRARDTSAFRQSGPPSRRGASDRSGVGGTAAACVRSRARISKPSAAPFHRKLPGRARPRDLQRRGSSV